MASCYGQVENSNDNKVVIECIQSFTLIEDDTLNVLQLSQQNDDVARKMKAEMRDMLNYEITESNGTYPQSTALDEGQFESYYCSHEVFVCTSQKESNKVIGSFYIKPNFPGRCGHVCNGGFLCHRDYRNKGIGKFLASSFESIAPRLGYKSAFFNLVFKDNLPSIKLWKSMNYTIAGEIKNAKALPDGTFVDAYMMQKLFD